MADQHHADHAQGTMDIREQEKTFAGFVRMATWVVCIVIGVLIFLGLANS